LAEISGSDTFLHVHSDVGPLVAQFTGVHHFELVATIPLYVSRRDAFAFASDGRLLHAPLRRGRKAWRLSNESWRTLIRLTPGGTKITPCCAWSWFSRMEAPMRC